MPIKLKGAATPGEADRRYYMIRVQVGGRREVVSSGTRDKKAALAKEQRLVEALRSDPTITKANLRAIVSGAQGAAMRRAQVQAGLTMLEAERRCMVDRELWGEIRSKKGYAINMKTIRRHFGDTFLVSDVTANAVKDFTTALLNTGRARGGITKVLAVLSSLLQASLKWPDGPKATPKIPMFKPRKRMFILSIEQERDMLAAIADEAVCMVAADPNLLVAFFRVLVETGMRRGEAMKLRWGDIASENGVIVLRLWRREELKTDHSVRTIPATPVCLLALESCRHMAGGPFLSLSKGRIERAWNKAKAHVGIEDPDCVPHSLRHTCATRLLSATGDIKLVQVWLGHSDITVTARLYAQVTEHRLRFAAEALTAARGTHIPEGNSFVTETVSNAKPAAL
jgi:integrase